MGLRFPHLSEAVAKNAVSGRESERNVIAWGSIRCVDADEEKIHEGWNETRFSQTKGMYHDVQEIYIYIQIYLYIYIYLDIHTFICLFVFAGLSSDFLQYSLVITRI